MMVTVENARSHTYACGTVEAVAERRVPARRPRHSHGEKGQLRGDSGALVAIRQTRRCRRHRVQPGRSSPRTSTIARIYIARSVDECLALAPVELVAGRPRGSRGTRCLGPKKEGLSRRPHTTASHTLGGNHLGVLVAAEQISGAAKSDRR